MSWIGMCLALWMGAPASVASQYANLQSQIDIEDEVLSQFSVPSLHPANLAIAIRDLSCHFGPKTAIDHLSLSVPQGEVFGLVGENGAGKTTLIKHITGLLEAETGEVSVFGMNPVANPVEVLSKIGYVSEHRHLPEWMTISQLIRYTQAFYSKWDMDYAMKLQADFALDPNSKCKSLSQGQRAKLSLLLAQSHRPELLLLDEPSSGLDPVVRRDIMEAIIRIAGEEGRTVFFSSHLLDEIERVCHRVAFMKGGQIVVEGTLESILTGHQFYRINDAADHSISAIPGLLSSKQAGGSWALICDDKAGADAFLQGAGWKVAEKRLATLDEIFVARVGRTEHAPAA